MTESPVLSPSPAQPSPGAPGLERPIEIAPAAQIATDSPSPALPPKDAAAAPTSTPPTPPSNATLPASETHEIMSEGNSDWEKVEKPLQSPPKPRASVKKDEKEGGFKGKVGEVKRVLKTGMFGHSPKSSPTTATSKPAIPARTTTRASLGPPRKAALPPPPASGTSRAPITGARATASTSAAASVPKPAVPARSRVSTLVKPTSSESVKPSTSLARSSSTSTKASTVRPLATARSAKSALPATTSVTKAGAGSGDASPTGSSTSTATATAPAAGPARVRTTTGPTRTTVSGKAGLPPRAPLASSTSSKPASRQVSGGQAETLASLAKAKEEKEAAEKELGNLKIKVDELEVALSDAKMGLEKNAGQQARERAELMESHSRAVEAARADSALALDESTGATRAEAEAKIADLKDAHAREVAALEERRDAQAQQVARQIAELTQAVQSVSQQHIDALAQLETAREKLSESSTAHSEAQEQVGALQRQLDGLRQERETRAGEVAEVKIKLDAAVKEKEKLAKEIKDGEEEAERSMVDLGGMKGRVEELEEEVQSLKGMLAGKGAEVEQVREEMAKRMSAIQAELDNSEGKEAGLALALSKSEAIVQEHDEEVKVLTAERNALLEQVKTLTTSAMLHDTDIQRVKGELEDAENEQERLAQIVLDSEGKIEKLEAALKAAEERAKAGKGAEERVRAMEEKIGGMEKDSAAISGEKDKLAERICELEVELKENENELKEQCATLLEDAKAKANAHHAKELSAIRTQLADTHSQFQAAHEAELESTAANHAAHLSSISADHSTQVGEMKLAIKKLDVELAGLKESETLGTKALEESRAALKAKTDELEAVKAELAGKGSGADDAEKKLEVALKELAGVRDELEGTKEVLEMNKSHFQLSLEELQSRHTKELHDSAAKRAEEDAERENAFRANEEKLREEVESLKREMQDNEVADKLARSKALEGIMSQKAVDERISELEVEHQQEVSRLEKWVEQLQAQLTAAPTPVPAPAAIPTPKVLDPIIIPNPTLISSAKLSPVRGTTFQAPKPETPAKQSAVKADMTPSKVPIPVSPLPASGAADGAEMEDGEMDMDMDGETDEDLGSSRGSLKAGGGPLVKGVVGGL